MQWNPHRAPVTVFPVRLWPGNDTGPSGPLRRQNQGRQCGKLEGVQTQTAQLLELVRKYKNTADRCQSKLHELLSRQKSDRNSSRLTVNEYAATKACAPDTPPSRDQMQQTVGESAESQAKELLSASAQDPSPSEQECPPSSQKQQRNDSPREKDIRPLRLPQEAVHTLLIGDSNLRKVDRRGLDRSGGTHVRTFPGATVSGMTASLSKRSPRDDVRTVVMHVGGNDMTADVAATTLKAPIQGVHTTGETCNSESTCAVYWHSSAKEVSQSGCSWLQCLFL